MCRSVSCVSRAGPAVGVSEGRRDPIPEVEGVAPQGDSQDSFHCYLANTPWGPPHQPWALGQPWGPLPCSPHAGSLGTLTMSAAVGAPHPCARRRRVSRNTAVTGTLSAMTAIGPGAGQCPWTGSPQAAPGKLMSAPVSPCRSDSGSRRRRRHR